MKKLAAVLVGLVLTISYLPLTLASPHFQVGEDVFIQKYQADDTYLGGSVVNLDKDVEGDLFVVGGVVTINGNVYGDLNVAGGNITINGNVRDDLRVMGGQVNLNGKVLDDLIIGAGNVNFSKDTVIGGDLIAGVGFLNFNGKINGNFKGAVGQIIFGGTVAQNADLKIKDKLNFSPEAFIGGNFNYTAPRKLELPASLVKGTTTFKESPLGKIGQGWREHNFKNIIGAILVAKLIYAVLALALIGLILIAVSPRYLLDTVAHINQKPGDCLWKGFLFLIVGPAFILIALLSVIGIPLAMIIGALYCVTLILGKVLAGMWVGTKLFALKKPTPVRVFGALVVGLLILKIIGLIPIAGWIIYFLVFLMALGALYKQKSATFLRLKEKKVV